MRLFLNPTLMIIALAKALLIPLDWPYHVLHRAGHDTALDWKTTPYGWLTPKGEMVPSLLPSWLSST